MLASEMESEQASWNVFDHELLMALLLSSASVRKSGEVACGGVNSDVQELGGGDRLRK